MKYKLRWAVCTGIAAAIAFQVYATHQRRVESSAVAALKSDFCDSATDQGMPAYEELAPASQVKYDDVREKLLLRIAALGSTDSAVDEAVGAMCSEIVKLAAK